MTSVTALRALARVEWRQILRHRRRSLLMLSLIAVPVAAIVGGATLLRIAEPTVEEGRAQVMGAAALRIVIAGDRDSLMAARRLLPAQARTAQVFIGAEQVRVPGRRLLGKFLAAEQASFDSAGIARGLVRLIEGRMPANSGEVALSPVLLRSLDRARGGTVTLAYGAARTITGVVVDPEALDAPVIVRTPAVVEDRAEQLLLATLPSELVAPTANRLRRAGFAVSTRDAFGLRGDTMTALVFVVGSLGFLEAALVIAAAVAVSLRRRRREIGLLGSVGATAGGIVTSMFVSAALLGVATAVAAAWFPARHAAGLPIRIALGGRRPVTTPARRWLIAGLAMEAVALALLVLLPRTDAVRSGLAVIGGSGLGVLGFGACSPWLLVALARRAAGLPLAWRLAVRDAGRFAARNGPVVTAILAGMSMSVMMAVLIASVESAIDARPTPYRNDHLVFEGSAAEDVARRAAAEFHAVAVAPVRAVYAHGMPVRVRIDGDSTTSRRPDWVACGDASLARAIGAETALAEFAAGALLVLEPHEQTGDLRLVAGSDGRVLVSPAIARVAMSQNTVAPAYLMTTASLEGRGLEPGPPPRRTLVPWIVRLPHAITEQTLERAQALATELPGTTVDAARLHRAPARAIYYVLLALCLVTGLVVILVSTALTAAESAGDEHVLRTVGAPPALLRHHQAARAGYLALLGCVLAVPAGMLPALGMLTSANIELDFVMPWCDVLLTVFGLPLLAYCVTWRFAGAASQPRGARPALTALVVLAAGGLTAHAYASPPLPATTAIRWEPYTGKAVDGSPLAGELGRFCVPERRSARNGRTIELAFVRYRTTHPKPGPPMFFIEGGPGGSGVEGCAFVATHPLLRMLEHCDVIGLDQRGTGLSRPDLAMPEFSYALPFDRAITREEEAAAFDAAVTRAVAYWRRQGVDLAAYNTAESADDIEDVRRAIGAGPIVLYGASYGSHLALACLRRHPDSIARAVLAKVEGPDDTWKLPGTVQRHLVMLHERARADPQVRERIPDLIGRVRELLLRLARDPVTTTLRPGARDSVRITLGPHDLRCALANALASTRRIAAVPRFLDELTRGEWTPLAELAVASRRANVGSVMALMMDCASGASAERRERIRREARDPANLLTDAIHAPFYSSTCSSCGSPDLGAAFRTPFTCDVPVLFVSGTLDVRTPPANVEAIRAGFTRHAHVRVNTGHDPRELISEEYRDVLQAFIRGERVASCELELPFRFEPFTGK